MALAECPSIKKLLIPSNVVELGGAVCYNDTALEMCLIGNGVSELTVASDHLGSGNYNDSYEGAFENCTSLKYVGLGSGLNVLAVDSFASTALTSIVLPSNLVSIGAGACYNTAITKAYFTGNAPSFIGEKVFYNSPGVVTYKLAGKTGFEDVKNYSFVEFTPVKVKFDMNDDEVFAVEPADQYMGPEGGYIIQPIDPVAEDYLFLGWYHEKECVTPWNFLEDKVTEDTTVYAKWLKTSESVPTAPTNIKDKDNMSSKITVTWDKVSGADTYNIYVDGELKGENITDTKYTITGLKANTAYEITVTALNKYGESPSSIYK